MKGKKVFALMLTVLMMVTLLGGCTEKNVDTGNNEGNDGKSNEKVTLTIACFTNDSEIYNNLDIESAFRELYPNVSIEIEEYKDTAEYDTAMKVRAAASDALPDIMVMKPYMFTEYKDYLMDISSLESAEKNLFSEDYKMDGKLYGLSTVTARSYVYYWTDLFEEAGVEVPKTWEDFQNVAIELKEYYTKDDPNFIALGVGAKDEWPTYPFMEFMPAAISNDGEIWNTMASQDEPFSEGTSVYTTYKKVYDLFTSGVSGKDPLGIGHDQVAALFAQKKVAMIDFAPTLLTKLKSDGIDTSTLSTFYLPVRDSEDEEFRTVIQGDNFLSISKDCENQEIAEAFVNFFFSDAWYPDFINSKDDDSALSTYKKEKDPVLAGADENQSDIVNVVYKGGNEDFTAIVSETKFDYKKLGSQFFIEGFDFEGEMNRLNEAWKQARETLGIE